MTTPVKVSSKDKGFALTCRQTKWLIENKGTHLCDNDEHMVAVFWEFELNALIRDRDPLLDNIISVSDIAWPKFSEIYRAGKLTPADDITRARRKMEELHDHLRGATYHKRHRTHRSDMKQTVKETAA